MNAALRSTILDLMDRHGIGWFDYEGPDGTMTLDADRPEQHPPVLADRPGIFLTRHPADAVAPSWPRRAKPGDIVGWLKIGPLLEPVRAREDATIIRPRLPDGALAGHGDRLF
jgi:acetyl-CoA carboxylase biotin carboxyl carrier protein